MIYVELEEEFKQKMYTRFVLDSASTLTLFSNDDYATQKITMFRLIKFIREKKMTALITSELSKDAEWYSRDTVSEFLVDGIIVLRYIEGEEGFRTLYIPKMRNTRQATAAFPMEITSNGIVVDSSIEKKV